MGILEFFHKIKMCFVRAKEKSIPNVSEVKRYGNYGEDEFTYMLRRELPTCKIKRNVVISTPEGNAEIDCLVLYQNKLFAIEVKRWKGRITEQEDGFLQEKTDRWTGQTYTKQLKSPFKQLTRAVHLLKKQIQIRAWVNTVVFFEDDELESVSVFSDNVCFCLYEKLSEHIRNEGEATLGTGAIDFFEKCTPADYLYAKEWDKSLSCVINRASLKFETRRGVIPIDKIESIRIFHHWTYDKMKIKLINGSKRTVKLENAKVKVMDNGNSFTYALCKLDYIELGRVI